MRNFWGRSEKTKTGKVLAEIDDTLEKLNEQYELGNDELREHCLAGAIVHLEWVRGLILEEAQ